MYLSIDHEKCTGCRICEVFCSFKHERVIQPSLSRITVVAGEAPGQYLPSTCLQCARPPCAEACPVGAISRDPERSVVLVNAQDCIGCRSCVDACPFGAMGYNEAQEVAYKCDLCGGEPECVKMCPKGAIEFLDIDVIVSRKRLAGPARLQRAIDLTLDRQDEPA